MYLQIQAPSPCPHQNGTCDLSQHEAVVMKAHLATCVETIVQLVRGMAVNMTLPVSNHRGGQMKIIMFNIHMHHSGCAESDKGRVVEEDDMMMTQVGQ